MNEYISTFFAWSREFSFMCEHKIEQIQCAKAWVQSIFKNCVNLGRHKISWLREFKRNLREFVNSKVTRGLIIWLCTNRIAYRLSSSSSSSTYGSPQWPHRESSSSMLVPADIWNRFVFFLILPDVRYAHDDTLADPLEVLGCGSFSITLAFLFLEADFDFSAFNVEAMEEFEFGFLAFSFPLVFAVVADGANVLVADKLNSVPGSHFFPRFIFP